jgi:hypothetical protein
MPGLGFVLNYSGVIKLGVTAAAAGYSAIPVQLYFTLSLLRMKELILSSFLFLSFFIVFFLSYLSFC